MTDDLVLRTVDLGYAYVPGRFAMRHLDLELRRGEILGLLGRNGAGKTTTVRVLTTLLPPTEGTAEILGSDIREGGPRLRSRIGVVLQTEAFDFVTVERNLTLYAFLWGVSRESAKARAEEMIELFELQKVRSRKPWALSGGERRRLQVARELMHDMDLLFLDEPTAGLDAVARHRILGYLKERARKGLSIVFTTHIMHEADLLCDRIAVLHEGKLLRTDTAQALKKAYTGARRVTIEFDRDPGASRTALLELLRERGRGIEIGRQEGPGLSFRSTNPEEMVALLTSWAPPHGLSVTRLDVREVTLEEAFLGLVGGHGPEEGTGELVEES